MAKSGRARVKRRLRAVRGMSMDVTPERLAKGDQSHWVNPGAIDSSEQPLGRARQFFKVSRLDRWHKAGVVTQRQFAAGEEYRSLHHRATAVPRVVASYGERTSAGESDYGMARTAAQARSRKRWRDAREAVPKQVVGFLDRFLIHDSLPPQRGRAQMRAIADARNALDALALHFEGR